MRIILTVFVACFCLSVPAGAQDPSKGGDKNKDSKQTTQGSGAPGLLGGSPSTPVIMLSGRVLLPDGSVPLQPVRIELICRETVREHSFSSSNGSFVLQIDKGTAFVGLDASFGGAEMTPMIGSGASTYDSMLDDLARQRIGMSPAIDLKGCELQASTSRFNSERIRLDSKRIQGYFDVGILVISPRESPPVGTVSVISLAAPDSAKSAFHEAEKELQRENPDRGRIINKLEEAIEKYPKYAVAWELLGKARLAAGDADGAREAFQKAVRVDPEYAGGQLAQAALNFQEHRWKEAADAAQRVTELNPDLIHPYYFHAFSSFQAGDFEASRKSAEHLKRRGAGRQFPVIHYIIGAVALKKKDLQTAATQFQIFLELQPDTPVAEFLQRKLRAWEAQGIVPNPEELGPAGLEEEPAQPAKN